MPLPAALNVNWSLKSMADKESEPDIIMYTLFHAASKTTKMRKSTCGVTMHVRDDIANTCDVNIENSTGAIPKNAYIPLSKT